MTTIYDQDAFAAFDGEMHRIYEGGKEYGYNATRFLQMLRADGGVATAKNLLAREVTDGGSGGLERMLRVGRLDLTVEWLVIQEHWRDLFTDDEVDEARRRLNATYARL